MNEWIQGRIQWFQGYLGFDDESLERAKDRAGYSARDWWANARRKRWLAVAFIYECMTFFGLWLVRVIFNLPPMPLWTRWVFEFVLFGALWLVLHYVSVKMAPIQIKESRRLAFWSGAFFWAMVVVPAIALFNFAVNSLTHALGW